MFCIQQCTACGFRFIDTSAADYPQDAQFAYDEAEIGPILPDLPHIQRRVRDILRYCSPPGRALDIGCGKGEVALALTGRGFKCAGIDLKPRVIEHLRVHYSQVEWHCALASDLAGMPERYDLLTLYHVLEHVADPHSVIEGVKALANPGALIVIEVPNVSGWKAHIKGRKWDYYKVDHVNYFRPEDLLRLARNHSLSVLAIKGYQHFSWPQGVLWKDMVKGVLGWLGFKDVISVFLRVP